MQSGDQHVLRRNIQRHVKHPCEIHRLYKRMESDFPGRLGSWPKVESRALGPPLRGIGSRQSLQGLSRVCGTLDLNGAEPQKDAQAMRRTQFVAGQEHCFE